MRDSNLAVDDFVMRIGNAALVIEIPAIRPYCRAWVYVAKINRMLPGFQSLPIDIEFQIIWTEVKKDIVQKHWEEGLEVEFKQDSEEYSISRVSRNGLLQSLQRWITIPTELSRFVKPLHSYSDYPFFL